jgi:hypothetical protein
MGKINPAAADLDDPAILGKRSQREYIIEELVKTERTYVQHLELLQEFKKLVEEKGIISGDQIHDIFLNLNALLDFQPLRTVQGCFQGLRAVHCQPEEVRADRTTRIREAQRDWRNT